MGDDAPPLRAPLLLLAGLVELSRVHTGAHHPGDVVAAVDGRVVAVGLAVLAGRSFVDVVSVGGYPHLVDAREQLEGRIGRWPAPVWCTVRQVARGRPLACRIDEGCLEVQVVAADRRLSRLRLLTAVLTGRLERSEVFARHTTPHLGLEGDHPLRVARDGETSDGPASPTGRAR